MHKPKSAPAARGGQYSIGLFGVCLTGQVVVAPPPAPLPPSQPGFRRSRIKGALNSFDRDGLTDKHYVTLATRHIEEELRLEREAYDASLRAQTTATMEAAARHSQKREEYEWYTAAREDQEESYAAFLSHWFPHVQAIMEGGAL